MKRIAFVRLGSFSHMNDRLLAALHEVMPGYAIDIVDVEALLGPRERKLAFRIRSHAFAYGQFGRLLLTGRERMHGLGGCLIRTTFYFGRLRELLVEQLSGIPYSFTLQTRSLFDASVPGVPHFVYTDHAELQCLRIPGFSPRSLFPPSWIALETSIYRNATIVFTMSEGTRRCLIDDYACPEERVACVLAGANSGGDGRESPPGRYASKRILFVATRWEAKGGPELAVAFGRVLQEHPDARLVVVGCSPALDLPNCEVVGRVALESVGAHYDQAAVFCVPTRREAFGNAFIEALAHGLPVVATRVGALPEHVVDGENGYLVEVGDVDALSARLLSLLDDPAECRRLGIGAGRSASAYTWPGTARAMRRHIETAIGPLG